MALNIIIEHDADKVHEGAEFSVHCDDCGVVDTCNDWGTAASVQTSHSRQHGTRLQSELVQASQSFLDDIWNGRASA